MVMATFPREEKSDARFPVARRRQMSQFLALLFLGTVICSAILSKGMKPGNQGASNLVAPRGKLNEILWRQGLSHVAFHQFPAKERLAQLVRMHNRVCVVGVEYGGEVVHLAKLGFEVHAFEPLRKFYSSMQRRLSGSSGLNVQLYRLAAGASAGSLQVRYGREAVETVPRARIDETVKEALDVLSVDIQGNEIDVVQGAQKLLQEGHIRSLWVEIASCSPKTIELLHLLDRHGFVVFDFVPWGQPKQSELNSTSLHEMSNAAAIGVDSRPAGFDEYCKWMCKIQTQHFRWLQSDVLAIRRELVTPQVMLRLSSLSNDLYLYAVQESKRVSKTAS